MQSVDLFTYASPPRYPFRAGHKVSGASKTAADKITDSGFRQTLEQKVMALFQCRVDWTPDEAAQALSLNVGDIRPRFSELCLPKKNYLGVIVRPVFLRKTDELRSSNRDNPQHVYRIA